MYQNNSYQVKKEAILDDRTYNKLQISDMSKAMITKYLGSHFFKFKIWVGR